MLAESFCNVENGSSIIMSKSLSKNLINENKHTLCFQRIGILIHILSWRQQKHQCLFSLLRFFEELFDVIIHTVILWKAKLESAYSFMLKYSKITVWIDNPFLTL